MVCISTGEIKVCCVYKGGEEFNLKGINFQRQIFLVKKVNF